MEDYRTQAANGKRWCYDCKHYRTSCMCGYEASECDIHGSLDVDQKERHPDKTADTCPDYTPNGKKPWWMKYEEREKENMTMENMVKTLENRGFYVEKTYNGKLRVYEFYIEKDSIAVGGNFEYPKSAHYSLVDRAQRVFIEDLVRGWNKEYAEKNKKGESNMSNSNKLMNTLVRDSNGKFVIGGDIYDVVVRDVVTDARKCDTQTTIICDLVADGVNTYVRKDIEMTSFLAKQMNIPKYIYGGAMPKIKDVIFNPPATIVFWADNTKTVVKCQEGDDFDPEKGLTMAITKKLFGNRGNYCEEIKKWVKKYKPEPVELYIDGFAFKEAVEDALKKLGIKTYIQEPALAKNFSFGAAEITPVSDGSVEFRKVEEKRWKIWWKKYDAYGKVVGSGVHHTDYDNKTHALIAANNLFDNTLEFEYSWEVSQDNPWEKD